MEAFSREHLGRVFKEVHEQYLHECALALTGIANDPNKGIDHVRQIGGKIIGSGEMISRVAAKLGPEREEKDD